MWNGKTMALTVKKVIRKVNDIYLPLLAQGCIITKRCVAYIRYFDTTLTFDRKVILCTSAYHHVYSWPRHNVDLRPQGLYRDLNMVSCSGHSFFVLWNNQTIFRKLVFIMRRCVKNIYDLYKTFTFGLNIN